jgi:tetratricopeptide (TPR) repeat protein
MAKAAVFRARGDYDAALEMLNLAAEAGRNDDDDVVEERFYIAIERKDVTMAESVWRTMRSRNLDGCEGNLAAAQLEMLKKNHTLALRRIDEALAIKPLSSAAYYLKSRIYQEMENIESAVENSRRATQMDPLNSLYSKNHASILFDRNNELGTRITPDQRNELLQAMTTAIVLNPNDWQLQSAYAEIISDPSPDRALALRQQLLQNHPTAANAVMLGNMALRMARTERDLAKRSGLLELSGKAFTQAFEMDPDNDAAKAAYAEFLRLTDRAKRPKSFCATTIICSGDTICKTPSTIKLRNSSKSFIGPIPQTSPSSGDWC